MELFGLLPLILISIPVAIGFGFLAKRLEKSPALWVVLSLIPVLNYFFWIYASFVILFYVLDSFRAIKEQMAALAAPSGSGGSPPPRPTSTGA